MVHVFVPTLPRIPVESFSPEQSWLFGVLSMLVLFSFAAAAVVIYRKTERGGLMLKATAPFDQSSEPHRKVPRRQRADELRWLEELMATPAYGEDSGEQNRLD